MMQSVSTKLLLLSAIIIASTTTRMLVVVVHGYPLIAQVPEKAEKCFNFNIPEDDDAHMVFMAMPMGEETGDTNEGKLEGWLVQEVYELTKAKKGGNLPTALLNTPPPSEKTMMEDFLQKRNDNLAKVKVTVSTDSSNPTSRVFPLKFFAPTVINQVREMHKKVVSRVHREKIAKEKEETEEGEEEEEVAPEEEEDLSGYEVCFENVDEDADVQIIMDIVFLNEEDEEINEPNFVKEKHLSPLEESLEQSIKAANTVLREMKYMTDREERMRVTADSINQRVQYFSIISVVILLAVTYVQVTYLKRYFKKKKLM